jgi:hypothetical protein
VQLPVLLQGGQHVGGGLVGQRAQLGHHVAQEGIDHLLLLLARLGDHLGVHLAHQLLLPRGSVAGGIYLGA